MNIRIDIYCSKIQLAVSKKLLTDEEYQELEECLEKYLGVRFLSEPAFYCSVITDEIQKETKAS